MIYYLIFYNKYLFIKNNILESFRLLTPKFHLNIPP